MAYGAVAETSVLTVVYVIIAAMTVLAIIAMIKKYNIVIDFKNGKMTISYDKV